MVELCAVVDRVAAATDATRALGDGPYVIVSNSTEGTLEQRIASRLALLRSLGGAACLPLRFGATVADDAAALGWLDDHRDALRAALLRVAGRCEFDLHLARRSDGAVAGEGGPGTRHLRALAARYATLSDADAQRALAACDRLPGVDETAVVADASFIAFLVHDATAFARAARGVAIDGARGAAAESGAV
jgi:hypothetical protein